MFCHVENYSCLLYVSCWIVQCMWLSNFTTYHWVQFSGQLTAGFPASGKIMETWKMKNTFSRPGKIMEFGKSPKNLEKSWNFKYHVHAFVHFIVAHGFVPNLFLSYILWLISIWIYITSLFIFIFIRYSASWKNGNISRKIMEFDSGIWLETL